MGEWRKSTYSDANGGSCIEVASTDLEEWRKSTYSGSNGGDCVETAAGGGVVLVRDTTDRDGGTLGFSAAAWASFTRALRG